MLQDPGIMNPAKGLSSTGRPLIPSAAKARKWNAMQQGNCSSPETQILRPTRVKFCQMATHAKEMHQPTSLYCRDYIDYIPHVSNAGDISDIPIFSSNHQGLNWATNCSHSTVLDVPVPRHSAPNRSWRAKKSDPTHSWGTQSAFQMQLLMSSASRI